MKNSDLHDQRCKLVHVILQCLNKQKIRCTYGAVGGVLGIPPQAVGHYLGERRPEASWVVNQKTCLPTKYLPEEKHPYLCRNPHIISDANELREVCRLDDVSA